MQGDLQFMQKEELHDLLEVIGLTKKDFYDTVKISQKELYYISQGLSSWNTDQLEKIIELILKNEQVLKETSELVANILNKDFNGYIDRLNSDTYIPLMRRWILVTGYKKAKLFTLTNKHSFIDACKQEQNIVYFTRLSQMLNKIPEIVQYISVKIGCFTEE